MQCIRYVSALTMTMGNYSMTYHFFVVDVPDTNVVLGVQWLYSLVWVTTDWKQLVMEFTSQMASRWFLGACIRTPLSQFRLIGWRPI